MFFSAIIFSRTSKVPCPERSSPITFSLVSPPVAGQRNLPALRLLFAGQAFFTLHQKPYKVLMKALRSI